MRDTGVPDRHGEAAVESSSRPIVTTVQQGILEYRWDYRERVGQLPPGLCLKALCEGHQDFLEVMEESTGACVWQLGVPPDKPVRFHIPTTFQSIVKLKQPIPTEDIKKVDWMMTKVPATGKLVGEEKTDYLPLSFVTKARAMLGSRSANRRVVARPKRKRQSHQSLIAATREAYQQVTSKRSAVIDIDMALLPKKPWVPDHPQAILAVEEDDDDQPTDLVTLACPPKSV
ncbi:unnamed protein product [Prunus armeniaca]